jgi:ubiquinone/menaquinone biosynthesis C-methylase UbiE
MDAGCGDGHVAMIAHDLLDEDAIIYAVDIYDASIEDMQNEVDEKGIKNIIPICADATEHIDVEDDFVDVILLINVWHHFNVARKMDEATLELKRILKPGGRIAVMEYKKEEARHGPRYPMRVSHEVIGELFKKHDMKFVSLDCDVGEDLGDHMSHYLIVFEK